MAPTDPLTQGQWGRSFPDRIDAAWPFLGFSQEDIKHLAVLDTPGGQLGGEMSELDDSGTYFDLGPKQATVNGIYHYLCTRNNNFSNRDQKAKIVISDSNAVTMALGWAGGSIYGEGQTSVYAAQGAFASLHILTLENKPRDSSTSMTDVDSDFVNVQPILFNLNTDQSIQVNVPYDRNGLATPFMYRSDTLNGNYEQIDAEFSGGVATTWTTKGGFFVVKNELNVAALVGVLIGCLAAIGIASYGIWWYRKKRMDGGKGRATGRA
jgi:hypothetical protein